MAKLTQNERDQLQAAVDALSSECISYSINDDHVLSELPGVLDDAARFTDAAEALLGEVESLLRWAEDEDDDDA